jgi:hypothetical protein
MEWLWTALKAFNTLAGLIRDFFHWKENEDVRQAGSDAAIVAGQKQEDAAMADVGQAIDEAKARHKADPTDDAFKNTEFRD